jgi:hypothetical protein
LDFSAAKLEAFRSKIFGGFQLAPEPRLHRTQPDGWERIGGVGHRKPIFPENLFPHWRLKMFLLAEKPNQKVLGC